MTKLAFWMWTPRLSFTVPLNFRFPCTSKIELLVDLDVGYLAHSTLSSKSALTLHTPLPLDGTCFGERAYSDLGTFLSSPCRALIILDLSAMNLKHIDSATKCSQALCEPTVDLNTSAEG
ncbi:hypothetical protein FRC12_005754 [Ceratobasidium sp. 428]|nr:hypothetical protein FRC12_005754 [Ceratobasidium sp. 428]